MTTIRGVVFAPEVELDFHLRLLGALCHWRRLGIVSINARLFYGSGSIYIACQVLVPLHS